MSRMTRAARALTLVMIFCASATEVLAGGGPQNVLVVYNSNSKYPYSKTIAEHYQAARGIHPDHMLGLDIDFATDLEVNQEIPGLPGVTFNTGGDADALNPWTILTVEEFTRLVYDPIIAHLEEKGLEDQVYLLVFVKGLPWRIWPDVTHDHQLSDATHPDELNGARAQPEGGFATTLARASFGNAFSLSAVSTASSKTDYFATCEAFRPNAFAKQDDTTKRLRFLVSLLYGPTINGDETATAITAIDRAVTADATMPEGTFAFLSTDNQARNARKAMCGIEIASLRQLGFGALQEYSTSAALPQYNVTASPNFVTALCGISLSAQTVLSASNPWSAWPWAPGALGDALTSFSGHDLDRYDRYDKSWYHITPEWWIMAGGVGGYGTGMEPGTSSAELATRFVAPFQYRRYVEGFSLAEVVYQSVEDIRFLTLVGDPLCAPYARRPTVDVTDLPATVAPGNPLSFSVAAAPHASGNAVRRLEVYIDGKFADAYEPSCPAGNTVTIAAGGASASYVTQAGDSRGTIVAALADTLNANAAGTLTAACQDIAFSAPTADGWPRWNAARRTNQPITDGLLLLTTAATGAAGNGVVTTASVEAADGNVYVRPRWLASQTYGGAQWRTATAALICYVLRKTGSETMVKTGGEYLTVSCTSGGNTVSQQVYVSASLTLTSQVQTLIQQAMVATAAAAETGGPGYYIYGTSVIRGLPGAPPETTFTVTHPDYADSGFQIILGSQTEQSGAVTAAATGGKNDGPGINYLMIDMGSAAILHTFQIDTSSLTEGSHDVLVVAIDGGAAEAQGYYRGTVVVADRIEIATSWENGYDWCYENTSVGTAGRNACTLCVTVENDPFGNSDYDVAVTIGAEDEGVATVEPTTDEMAWKIVGGWWADGAAGTVGQSATATVHVTVTGVDIGGEGTAEAVVTVRHLGDVNGNGRVTAEDKIYINIALNGSDQPFGSRAVDLDGDGAINASDKLIINSILNGASVN